ncbi:DinB family protein [Ferruginibacter sp. SUN106]|uniref:DinB family protein n=1 Tax=Ferruginibacter sp. SUN106 TaxID=2978348 RepID=UPI003D36DAF1
MQKQIELIKQTRNRFIQLVEGLSIGQLNEIPAGMSNNIAWNFGHIVAAQQGLCNGLSGVALNVLPDFIANFKKGTKPEGLISEETINLFKGYMLSNISDLEKALGENVFINYQPYVTSYGYPLNNIEDAVRFVSVHDALHLGYSMAIRKSLSTK